MWSSLLLNPLVHFWQLLTDCSCPDGGVLSELRLSAWRKKVFKLISQKTVKPLQQERSATQRKLKGRIQRRFWQEASLLPQQEVPPHCDTSSFLLPALTGFCCLDKMLQQQAEEGETSWWETNPFTKAWCNPGQRSRRVKTATLNWTSSLHTFHTERSCCSLKVKLVKQRPSLTP